MVRRHTPPIFLLSVCNCRVTAVVARQVLAGRLARNGKREASELKPGHVVETTMGRTLRFVDVYTIIADARLTRSRTPLVLRDLLDHIVAQSGMGRDIRPCSGPERPGFFQGVIGFITGQKHRFFPAQFGCVAHS